MMMMTDTASFFHDVICMLRSKPITAEALVIFISLTYIVFVVKIN